MICIKQQCALVTFKRFLIAFQIEQKIAAIVQRVYVRRSNNECSVITRHRVLVTAECVQDVAVIQMKASRGGIFDQRRLDQNQSFIVAALLSAKDSKIMLSVVIIGKCAQYRLVAFLGLRDAPGLMGCERLLQ